MKKQVVLIKGGVEKSNYNSFLDFIKSIEYSDVVEINKKWSSNLEDILGEQYFIYHPNLLIRMYSNYEHWKIMFEKLFPFLDDDIIFIGHSLGGTFLSKYLSENKIEFQIKALFLVAPAFSDSDNEKLGSFNFKKDFSLLNSQVEKTYLYGSKDDPIVSFQNILDFQESNLEIYKTIISEDKGHYLIEDFPELIEEIKNV